MTKGIFCILIAVAFLTGCTSTITNLEPASPTDTLIVGRAEFKCINAPRDQLAPRVYKEGLIVQLQDVDTKEQFTVYTEGKHGYFLISKPSIKTLKLKKITAKDYFTGCSAFIAPNHQNIYPIQSGKVNNLGLLMCYADLDNSDFGNLFNREYEDTETLFSERYPDSKWNSWTWTNLVGEDDSNQRMDLTR